MDLSDVHMYLNTIQGSLPYYACELFLKNSGGVTAEGSYGGASGSISLNIDQVVNENILELEIL